MTDDLVTWLRAQLDKDEDDPGPWSGWDDASMDVHVDVSVIGGEVVDRTVTGPLMPRGQRRHLADVGVKRQILDAHVPTDDRGEELEEVCRTCHEDWLSGYDPPPLYWPCPTVRLLALPYARREGYREEWRP